MSKNSTYEGYVKHTAGKVYSVQCAEGRHDECPDDTPDDDCWGPGPLEGYYCECSCGHEPELAPCLMCGDPTSNGLLCEHRETGQDKEAKRDA